MLVTATWGDFAADDRSVGLGPGTRPVSEAPGGRRGHQRIVERERLDCGDTWRQRKRQLILRGPQGLVPALERVRRAASDLLREQYSTDVLGLFMT
jgi:hypothetical protein